MTGEGSSSPLPEGDLGGPGIPRTVTPGDHLVPLARQARPRVPIQLLKAGTGSHLS